MTNDTVRDAMAQLEAAGQPVTKNAVCKRVKGRRETVLKLFDEVMQERGQAAPAAQACDSPVAVMPDWSGVTAAQARLSAAEQALHEAAAALDEARLTSLTATQMDVLMQAGWKLGSIRQDDPWCVHVRGQVQACQGPYHAAVQGFLDAQDAVSQARAAVSQAQAAAVDQARKRWVA